MRLELVLLRASPGHARTLTDIAFAAKRYWNYPENWIQFWSPQLTISPDYILSNETWLAEVDGEAVAFYALGQDGDCWELDHFWVRPSSIRQGLGTFLFHHALARCRKHGIKVLKVESDPNAVGFYEKMGARRVGERHMEVDGQPRQLPVLEMML